MASKIREELLKIAADNGGKLLPETVVEAAKDETSPLHGSFEWDDTEAARTYRLWQARQLISVVVQYIPGSKHATNTFVSLKSDRKSGEGYRVMTVVLSDEQLRSQLLADAYDDMQIFRSKYKHLKELVEVFRAMNKVLK